MRRTIKVLSLLMCFALALSSLGALAENEKAFVPYDEPITITVARPVTSNVKFDTSNPDRESIESNLWVRTYKEELNIDVEYLFTAPTADEYTAKWYTAIASGDIPDFAAVNEAVYLTLLEAGLVADMTDIFPEYASDFLNWCLDRGGHVAEPYITFDGRMYGIPCTGTAATDTQVMIIRDDWLADVNKEIPKTIDELVDVAQAFVDADLGGEGTTVGLPGSESFSSGYGALRPFFNAYGSYLSMWIDDGEGNLVYGTVQDETRDALLKLQEMYAAGLINQDFAVCTSDASQAIIASGRAGMAFVGYAPTAGMGPVLEDDEDASWTVCHVPGLTADDYATQQASANPSTYYFVSALCEHPEACVKMQNLECDKMVNDYYNYSTTVDRWEYFLYMSTGSPQGIPRQNPLRQSEATHAYLTGELDFTVPLCEISYQRLIDAEGNRLDTNPYLWGPNSTFQIINEDYDEGRCLVDAYQTQMTENMMLKKELLDTALTTAMQKVIMGDDISVFDKEVENWYAQGGQQMTDEANEWYHAK